MDNLAADFEINPNNPLNAEYELGEGVGFDCSFELFASGTVWGSINGDINNQTDLINLLNTKVDLTSFEELSQTVTNNYNELTGDISDLTTTVTDNYNTLSGQISDLTTTVNDNYTSLDNRLTTAEGSILDLTDTVNDNYTELDGKITTTNNNLSSLSQTVENNNTAINDRVDGIVDSFDGDISDLNDAIDNLSDTVSDNYTELNDKITDNTDDITTIQNTINSYGDIVSYDAAYFATANQGALADSALQPNDNISELVNDVGYITSASLPTVNNATITIQKNSSSVGTFTLNQANNATLNITVPTQASDIGAMPDTTTIEDLTTTAQLNALNSGATATNIGQITTNQNNIADIIDLIPLQASTSNQLADKGFVNSSIATNTANFIGTFNSVAELEAYSGTLTNNDYAFVATTDSAGNTLYDRYKYNADTQEWLFEYELNNSSFTAQQWASINSGITSGDVALIGTALQPNDNISELINDAGYITSASLPTVNNGTLDIQVNGTSIGTFTANQSGNTTANIVVPDSATWGNITGTLSNQTDLQTALNGKYDASNPSGYTSNVGTVTSVNNVSPVSGNVTLSIPSATSDLTNDSGFITSSDLTNYVTTNTTQNITETKTFVGNKKVAFKQSSSSDKLGFTLYTNGGIEKGYLEYNPSNTVDSVPLMTLGNYASASGGLTHVGFRKYSGISGASGAYNLLAPLISDARTPFNLTTTYTNFYLPLGFTDGNTTVLTSKSGMVDLSSIIPSGVTVDQTYDATSANAQSGVAIAGAGFLKNTATGSDAITILGNASNKTNAINIGVGSTGTGTGAVAIGKYASASQGEAIALGYGASASAYSAIQLGIGTNSTAYTFSVGFGNNNNYQLLDGTTGLIPDARISSNIARTSSLATVATTGDYSDLLNKPTLGTMAAESASDYTPTSSLATVATTGAYSDLSGTPTIPTLYSTTGQNTDGAMTQDATTQAINSVKRNIGEIATDLNGKADVDLTNVTDTAKIAMAGASMPSSTYTDLTLGASGSTYTAPANGWVSWHWWTTATSTSYMHLANNTTGVAILLVPNQGAVYAQRCYIPVAKGDVFGIAYANLEATSGAHEKYLRFVYANGSESEA